MKRLKKVAFFIPFVVAGGLMPFVTLPHYFLTGCGVVALFASVGYMGLSWVTGE